MAFKFKKLIKIPLQWWEKDRETLQTTVEVPQGQELYTVCGFILHPLKEELALSS